MNLGDTVYKHIAGRSVRAEVRESPAALVGRALAAAGGVSQLARSLGIARTTVQRWNKGSTPTEASQQLMRSALRQAGLGGRREARLRMSDALTVVGKQQGRKGLRTIKLGPYLRPGTMDLAVTAFLRGASPFDLHVIVWSGITDQRYAWLFQPPGGAAQLPRNQQVAVVQAAGAGGGGGGGGGASGGAGGWDEDDFDEDGDWADFDLAYEEYDVPELAGYEIT